MTGESLSARRPKAVLQPRSISRITSAKPINHEQIARLAYDLWKARGCPHGSAEVDWLQAEQELRLAITLKNSQSASHDFPKKILGAPRSGRTTNRSRTSAS